MSQSYFCLCGALGNTIELVTDSVYFTEEMQTALQDITAAIWKPAYRWGRSSVLPIKLVRDFKMRAPLRKVCKGNQGRTLSHRIV